MQRSLLICLKSEESIQREKAIEIIVLQGVDYQGKDCCLAVPEGKQGSHRSNLSSSKPAMKEELEGIR